jgi:hypothetical protein
MVCTVGGLRARLMLAALAARLLVPLLGPAAVELDPYHTHVTIGGTPRQRAAALAHHRRDHPGDAATCHDREGAGVRVLSITAGPAAGALVASLTGAASAVAAGTGVPGPERSGVVPPPDHLCHRLSARAVPEPPPEIA